MNYVMHSIAVSTKSTNDFYITDAKPSTPTDEWHYAGQYPLKEDENRLVRIFNKPTYWITSEKANFWLAHYPDLVVPINNLTKQGIAHTGFIQVQPLEIYEQDNAHYISVKIQKITKISDVALYHSNQNSDKNQITLDFSNFEYLSWYTIDANWFLLESRSEIDELYTAYLFFRSNNQEYLITYQQQDFDKAYNVLLKSKIDFSLLNLLKMLPKNFSKDSLLKKLAHYPDDSAQKLVIF